MTITEASAFKCAGPFHQSNTEESPNSDDSLQIGRLIYLNFRYHLYFLDKTPAEHYTDFKFALGSSRECAKASGGHVISTTLSMKSVVENAGNQVGVCIVQMGLAWPNQEVVEC
jgi:hypothetical protein